MVEIHLEGIDYSYGRKRVLRGLSWAIRPGVTGLLGENGAGKTTLMSVLVRLRKPQSGKVTIGGSGEEPTLGFVPQRFSMPGEMRLVDVVSYAAWLNGVPSRSCEGAALGALEAVDLAQNEETEGSEGVTRRVRSLSGGQRQRLGIAAGLAHQPDVLVLDEPTVGLDVRQRDRVISVIRDLGQLGRNVLLSTHMLNDVEATCQRVGVLVDGHITFDGTTAELRQVAPKRDAAVPPPMRQMEGLEPDALENPVIGAGSELEQGYRTLLEGGGGAR